MTSQKVPKTLMDMPEVPMKNIVSWLDPASLVTFASSHEKFEEFINTVNLNVERLSLKITDSRFDISLTFFYSNKKFEWKFVGTEDVEYKFEEVKKTKSNTNIDVCENTFEEGKEAVKWLTTLIRFPVTAVEIIGPDFAESAELLEWTHLHQIEKLSLEMIENVDCSVLTTHFKDLEQLDLVSCSCLTPPEIAHLKIAKIQIFNVDWTSTVIHGILEEWKSGRSRDLQFLWISLKYPCVRDEIISGFETKAWNQATRARHFLTENEPIDCRSGLDIERDDGLLASILIEDSEVQFVVWHQRFPDAENMES